VTSNRKPAQQRENPEPSEGSVKTPKLVLAWIAILIVWGVGYYAWQIGKPLTGGDSRTPVEVSAGSASHAETTASQKSAEAETVEASDGATVTASHNNSANSEEADTANQAEPAGDETTASQGEQTPGADGKAIFTAQCSACHQASGQGVPGAFPPLAGSHWAASDNPDLPLAIVHDGLKGEITVAGNTFNGVMPTFKGTLSSAEIAAVLTYVRQAWGNDAAAIDVSTVEKHNETYGDRGPWTVDELKQTFKTP
jgi:mono/diheme cytochrome c family protein